jgi:hypothetical protein
MEFKEMAESRFPALPLNEWEKTRDTIQRYCQLIGAIRESLTPRMKHWCHINLRPDVRGFATPPISVRNKPGINAFKIVLDLMAHRLLVLTDGAHRWESGLAAQSMSGMRDELLAALNLMSIQPQIDPGKFDGADKLDYDKGFAEKYWIAIRRIANVFESFKAGLRQETSTVNLWPHHFDMAFVWFSGRLVPGADAADAEYADEQMNFGFSTGDEDIREPYFYISAYPMPDGLRNSAMPDGATWYEDSWKGARMNYAELVESKKPEVLLLNYLETLHEAGSKLMLG